MKKINLLIIITSIMILVMCFVGSKGELVENLELPVGVGTDLDKETGEIEYIISLAVSSQDDSEKKNIYIIKGTDFSIGETRERRQVKSGKKFMLGLTKLYIYSEDAAKFGMKNFMDVSLSNAQANDRALSVIYSGKAYDILKRKVPGYPNSSEFIENMIRNSSEFNFFPQQYTLMDIMVRLDAEGRNLLLPYIDIKEDEIITTGLAIFKGEKMVARTDIEEARIINMLKESKLKGMFTLGENSEKYINFSAKTKRKIKCYKENGKYKFVIDLKIKGAVVSNQLYKDLNSDNKVVKKLEEDMKLHVEKLCNDNINKIIKKYGVDVLDLGRVAAAKYGRGTGVDWNEEIINSEIIVNAKVKVDNLGRGDY